MKSQAKLATATFHKKKATTREVVLLLVSEAEQQEWLIEKVTAEQNARLHAIVPSQISNTEGEFDAVVLNGDLATLGGMAVFEAIEEQFGVIPVIVVDSQPPKERLGVKPPPSLVGYIRRGEELKDSLIAAIQLCQAKLAGSLSFFSKKK